MKTKIISSILLLNILFANSQEKDFNKKSNTKESSVAKSKSLDTGMQLFEKDNYSIQYPKKWKMESPGSLGEAFCIMGPKEEEYVYVNLIQEEESKQWLNKSFNEYVEHQVKSFADFFKVTKTEKIENNLYKIEFDTVMEGEILKSIRYFYLTDKKDIYLLTFCARDNFFNTYLQQGDTIIKSFKINNQLMNVK